MKYNFEEIFNIKDLQNVFKKEREEYPEYSVFTNMIFSINGEYKINNSSKQLGNNIDQKLLSLYRSTADVILVGANTIRKENYNTPKNQIPIAIVSSSMQFDHNLKIFQNSSQKPIIFTSKLTPNKKIADKYVHVYIENMNAEKVIQSLKGQGYKNILCEGGLNLINQLSSFALIDAWNITISPKIIPIENKQKLIFNGYDSPNQNLELTRCWRYQDFLFLKYMNKLVN